MDLVVRPSTEIVSSREPTTKVVGFRRRRIVGFLGGRPVLLQSARQRICCLVVLCLASLSGCQRSDRKVHYPVQGTVTLHDKTITNATLHFENVEEGIGVTAPLTEDGTYEVRTLQGPGLPKGVYKVAIFPGRMMTPEEIPLVGKEPGKPIPRAPIPEKYHRTATSGLSIEVKPDSKGPYNFDLDSRQKKS